MDCYYKRKEGQCGLFTTDKTTAWCVGDAEPCPCRRMTNGDRIRAMSDEELAASRYSPGPYDDDGYGECKYGWHDREQTCEECKLEWLGMPVNKETDNG